MNVNLFCPNCNSPLKILKYEVTIKILKERVWLSCTKCKFSVEDNKFSNAIFTT